MSETTRISVIDMTGFVGVSMKTMRVFGRSARSTLAGSDVFV
jgi:hypothetical protein